MGSNNVAQRGRRGRTRVEVQRLLEPPDKLDADDAFEACYDIGVSGKPWPLNRDPFDYGNLYAGWLAGRIDRVLLLAREGN